MKQFAKMSQEQHDYKIKDVAIQRLKGQKVLFILPSHEYPFIEEYKKLIPQVWTLTPIEVIKYSELKNYQGDKGYAFFNIKGLESTVTRRPSYGETSRETSYTNRHYFLSLSTLYATKDKQGKDIVASDELCRMDLYPEFKAVMYNFSAGEDEISKKLYTETSLRNFKLPYILSYLRYVQKNIEKQYNPWLYENIDNVSLKAKLAVDTLYIPEQYVFDRNKFNGKESLKQESFFKSYKGIYKIISNQKLLELILNGDAQKPLFLFEYILSSSSKYVVVWDINSGTRVHRRYVPMSYNLKEKDIKEILN